MYICGGFSKIYDMDSLKKIVRWSPFFDFYNPPITQRRAAFRVNLSHVYKLIVQDLQNLRVSNFRSFWRSGVDFSIKEYKSKYLPFVSFSGSFFPSRNVSSITSYSSYLVFDIDHYPLTEELMTRILLTSRPLLIFISPSGLGFKVVFSYSYKTGKRDLLFPDLLHIHNDFFNAGVEYFSALASSGFDGLCVDGSGKDLTRLCFLSFSTCVYFAPSLLGEIPQISNF